jgi:hypothetical protein
MRRQSEREAAGELDCSLSATAVEDQCRSVVTAANTAAMTADYRDLDHAEYVPSYEPYLASVQFSAVSGRVLRTAMAREHHNGFESQRLRS